jgi:zinc transport system ATP-binding protein
MTGKDRPTTAGEGNAALAAGHAHHAHVHDHGHTHADRVRPDLRRGALVSLRGIGITRDGRAILDGIDLDIAPSEIVTVIGPNGSGKTTLIRIMLGLIAPDRGRIERRPGLVVGYVPQRFDIDAAIPLTVRRFLALGAARAPSAIVTALAEVGAEHVIDQQMAVLSGGELQRVLLARALLRDPALLVLDEPARGVDHAGEADLYGLIADLRTRRGLAVLLVSHDLHIVMACSDRVVCINRHVCCEGVPHQVARDPEYARLFGPEAARAIAIYHHEHDHHHDLAGAPRRDADARDG